MNRQMILNGELRPAPYTMDDDVTTASTAIDSQTAIPLSVWLHLNGAGEALEGVGVILKGDDDIAPLEPHIHTLPFVAIHFQKFADGRGYSHGKRVTAIWGYEGVVLAFGDVLRDQLFYMHQCGFNAFYMRDDQNLQASLAAFTLYSDVS
jgi:uncharacterized protein (DUF934 family)